MKLSQRWIFPWALAGAWVLCAGVEASATRGQADSLFQAAMGQVGRVPAKEGLKAFERVLKSDWNYAPAHFEMAKLYMSLDTPVDRQHARNAIDEAIRLDPENVTYQLMLGDLLRAQGFLWPAGEQYEKIARSYPKDARAAYKAGLYFLEEFMRYKDTKKFEGDAKVSYEHFAEEDRKKAIFYLERIIELDPTFRDAYYRLGMVYVESRQPKELIRVAEQLLKQYPDDKDVLLFRGLGYHITGADQEAYEFYTEALNRMGSKERDMMESVDLLLGKDPEGQAFQNTLQSLKADPTREWYERPEMVRFWRKQDPLFLSKFNERRMEHYCRVAYANLRFSQPSRGISGWQTDMGKAWVKFGRYLYRTRSPSDRAETWFYEDFQISFASNPLDIETLHLGGMSRNDDPIDRLDMSNASGPSVGEVPIVFDGDEAIARFFQVPKRHIWLSAPAEIHSPQYVFDHTPARYVDPYRNRKYILPHQVSAFREGDSVRVELSYAIPKNKLGASGTQKIVDLEDGFFLFDEKWEEVFKKTRDSMLKLSVPERPEQAGTDSLRKNYLLAQRQIYVRPGPYHVVVEALDRGTGSIGTFRDLGTFSFPDTVLTMSNLLLASQIESQTPSPKDRKDLKIVPNPLRTFRRSEPVSVYFEVYNLKQEKSGLTEYEISYRISRPKKKEVDPTLFAALDLPEAQAHVEIEGVQEEGENSNFRVRYVLPDRNQISRQMMGRTDKETDISVTARYAGERKDDFAYLQVDVGRAPAGVYKLTVTVRDARTGRTAERETLFRVVE